MNFRIGADADGRLTITADPVAPVPPDLRAWADATKDLSVAGRLLE